MELKSLGTFNHAGRPIDTIRFEAINGKQIKYQSIGSDDLIAMPVQSIVKIAVDPHPDYFTALDKLVPFAIKVMDLGKNWQVESSIGSLRLEWSYNNTTEKYTYKIAEITIFRSSDISEIPIDRSLKFGGIIIDDIPWEVRDAIEDILDQAWFYCTGKKTAQLNLFEMPNPEPRATQTLASIQEPVKKELLDLGVKSFYIEDYFGFAGESPSALGFAAWQSEEDAEQPTMAQSGASLKDTAKAVVTDAISRSKGTRSKAKKEAVTA
ncbi:MAG: hypothetical protein H7237_03615 [Alkalinema sp. FL-bin-369]|nr:hypothetical protein [Leptolyngbyaceae cyanobacterium LF-bin-369]